MSLDVSLIINADVGNNEPEQIILFSANITHNLNEMAMEAGIYKHLWRPEEIGAVLASDIVEDVSKGLTLMKSDPDRFKAFDAPNGWGLYEHFIPWIEEYLEALIKYPKSVISVSR